MLCSLSDFLFVTQGVCNRDGKMRKEGEETEEKGDEVQLWRYPFCSSAADAW